jgi:NADH:ubiquinone oxidoreductase subunit 6 (subunit J)
VTLSVVAFWVLAVLLVGSALAVVLSKNLFHAVLWLALALTGTAGVFLLLNAEFLAAVQLLLYAGGIITIVVFAIVVTTRLLGEQVLTTYVLPFELLALLMLAAMLGAIYFARPED